MFFFRCKDRRAIDHAIQWASIKRSDQVVILLPGISFWDCVYDFTARTALGSHGTYGDFRLAMELAPQFERTAAIGAASA